jgi:hypothetical protein
MLNSMVLIAILLVGSEWLWLTHKKAQTESRRAYQPVVIRVDEPFRRRRGQL